MKIITTTYSGPDLDGYGCAMAYAELLRTQGKDARAHIWGTPQIEVQWLLETFQLPHAEGPSEDTKAQVILLDASKPNNLPSPLAVEQVMEIIDHRKLHEAEKFPHAHVQIELVGAAATLVAERFKQAHREPTKESALFLYGGILSNTQNFTTISTDRDREMAHWLKEVAHAPSDLARQMFIAKSDLSGHRLKKALLGDLKTLMLGGKAVVIAQLEIIGVDKLLANRKEEIAALLEEAEQKEKADYTFANMKDLDTGISKILCNDEKTMNLLHALPNSTWNGLLGTSPVLTLRKQLSVWVQERLVS